MTTQHTDQPDAADTSTNTTRNLRVALLGNPNTGKTTLFNRLSGLRHKTSNFAGTTLEARIGVVRAGSEGGRDADFIDMPGVYSLELDQLEARLAREVLSGTGRLKGQPEGKGRAPDVACVVVDATNLARNLTLVGEVLRRRLPTVVAVNMIDLARRQGLPLDEDKLSDALGCRVVFVSSRSAEGFDALRAAIRDAQIPVPRAPVPGDTPLPSSQSRHETDDTHATSLREWAQDMYARGLRSPTTDAPQAARASRSFTDRLDALLMHPVFGVLTFALVMTGLFFSLFKLATIPMDWIDALFSFLAEQTSQRLGDGVLSSLLADGVIAGVGATVIFLPQICLLFFLFSLLEDTGYLARAAFVMDRVLRPFGLNGHSFVPLLSSHACAIPGIMACRAIPDRKERLATILVAPFMTCSARIPVYVLLTTLLFADNALLASIAFTGCYFLGALAGILSALVARRTILKGAGRPMALELPTYKLPSVRTALITTYDRGFTFLKQAGTVILAIVIVLWWLGEYPKATTVTLEASELESIITFADAEGTSALYRAQPQLTNPDDLLDDPFNRTNPPYAFHIPADLPELDDAPTDSSIIPADELLSGNPRPAAGFVEVDDLRASLESIKARHQAKNSYLGRIGQAVQPLFEPIGYDWKLSIGVMASFAAREVFVSTMAVVTTGSDDTEDQGVLAGLRNAERDDGSRIFNPATSWSLLVFYVLAMQCLPTLAVTAKEAGGWKWALLQLAWMSVLAYIGALLAFTIAS